MRYLIEESTITNIADAIRSKTGSSNSMTPSQMVSEIEGISGGGGIIELEAYMSTSITSYMGNESIILDRAFYYCRNLVSISFPECSYIGASAFYGCSSLTMNSDIIVFPKCEYICNEAFRWCSNSSFTYASFPKCKVIGTYAFAECRNLYSACFSECITVSGGAFSGCSNLYKVSFPELTFIGNYGFAYCLSLGGAFSPVIFPKCSNISSYAFNSCSNIYGASFPMCNRIGGSAFKSCTKLSSLYLMSNSIVTLDNSNAFDSSPLSSGGTGKIYVPSSLLNSYKTAANWSRLSYRLSGK